MSAKPVRAPRGGRGLHGCVSVMLLGCLFLLLGPRGVTAGTYDVVACSGGPDNSWVQFADPGMSAYDSCPNNPSNLISGMIARASVGSGSVGYLQGAYQVFTAPPGSSLQQMTFTAAPYRWETQWTAGIVAFDGDFNRGDLPWGCYGGQPGCGIVSGSFTGPYTIGLGGHAQVRIEARCGNGVGCTLASSGTYPYTRATIAIANVSVRVQDATQPGVSITGGGLASARWVRGVQGVSFDASDNVGIRETGVRVDGRQVSARGKPCDYTLRVPCPQGGDSNTIDTATIRPDGAHTLTVDAVDSAGNLGQTSSTILVDNSPPAQPGGLVLEGGEGWRARNDFHLLWQNPPENGTAPIDGASYEICAASGGDCQAGTREGRGIGAIDGLTVPRAGEYVARVWLRDEAGNEDIKTAGQPLHLRFDDQAPELSFDEQDARDPTRLLVSATDRVSGVAGGEIEVRKAGAGAWYPLQTTLEGARLIARLDDERISDGTYELRARAFDRAGNERSTDRRSGGQKAEVTLPLRIKTLLRGGVLRHSKQRKGRRHPRRPAVRLLGRSKVGFGRRARISGLLTDVKSTPITDAEVNVSQMQRRQGASFAPLARLRTSGSGRFSYLVPPGPARVLRFRYPGSLTVRPATRDIELLVSASTTLKVNKRFALNGEAVTFSGRLRGGPVPDTGKLVELQAHVRAHWRTFATARASGHGLWSFAYRFDGTRGRQIYSFRARLPREAAYPYEAGHSKRVRVTVLGL